MKTERTTLFLMANLGSEITRFFGLKKRGQVEFAKNSADRAFKIIDSFADHNIIETGRKEIEILKTIIEDALSTKPNFNITESDINSYFRPFALRVIS